MKKISIIIVSYNVKYYLEQCLTSVLWATKDIDAEVIVVDNHSKDGSVEYLNSRFADKITLISSNHNLGFAKANNIAIKQCKGEYVLLLNPDTIVTEASIKDTIAFMDEHPKAGGLGVRMIKADGSNALESRRGLPAPMTAFYKMCGLCSRFPSHPRFGHYYMSGISWDEPHRIEVISGAFFLLRKEALEKAGLLDEDYFMYGEDIELSYQLLQAGYENWYHPSVILHYKGESTYKSSFRYVHVFYKAMLIFFRKNYGHLSFIITLPIKAAILVKATIEMFKMLSGQWRDSLGLRKRSKNKQPLFVFIGSDYTLSQCRKIAQSKGLSAVFHEGTVGTLPKGHLQIALPDDRPLEIVYDVHAYSYADIFRIFAEKPMEQITIGTYDNNTHKIITLSEVIYDNQNRHED